MTKILHRSFVGLFLVFALLGFTYFGPPKQTAHFRQMSLYKQVIAPFFDHLLSAAGYQTVTVGTLKSVEGELNYQPATELVYFQANEGQEFLAGTLLSSGADSKATVSLVDNSLLTLEENSLVLLEIPEEKSGSDVLILKVLKGRVRAKKTQNSNLNLRLVSSKGRSQNVNDEDIEVGESDSESGPIPARSRLTREGATPDAPREKTLVAPAVTPPSPTITTNNPLAATSPAAVNPAATASPLSATPGAQTKSAPTTAHSLAAKTIANRHPASVPSLAARPARSTDLGQKLKQTRPNTPASLLGGETQVRRVMAAAEANPGFEASEFNDSARQSLNELMLSYSQNQDCDQALGTLEKVQRSYRSDIKAKRWVAGWQKRLTSCGSFSR